MAAASRVSHVVVARATRLPQTAGATRHWDGRRGLCRAVGSQTVSEPGQPSAFQVKGPPATAPGARRFWTTEEIGLVPTCAPQTIAWDQVAALLTFSLAPTLLAATARAVPSGVTGALVWVPCPAQTASPTPAVHPVLMVQAPAASRQAARVTIVPALPAHDPLLHHMALVLQAALEGEGGAGQLSATALADARAVHFLRRYAASRPVLPAATGGLPPYKLRRTIAYIQDHLEHTLSLVELAAVAHMSPHHFAHLFKQATGRTPHQYVTTCRMEQAKQLLVETDVPLSDIALQVGCADHSHFTALFRQHVGTTPKVYRTGRRSSAGSIPSVSRRGATRRSVLGCAERTSACRGLPQPAHRGTSARCGMSFFLTEVTHDGFAVVDHRPGAPVWRSAPLGHHSYGYAPSGLGAVLLIMLIVLLLTGRL